MCSQRTNPCANCERLQEQLATLQAQHETLHATVGDLQATVAQLQAQLAAARKDSSTSSKPPSSDIVKPPKPDPPPGQDKRPIGGQGFVLRLGQSYPGWRHGCSALLGRFAAGQGRSGMR
jgi:hypothetical protein